MYIFDLRSLCIILYVFRLFFIKDVGCSIVLLFIVYPMPCFVICLSFCPSFFLVVCGMIDCYYEDSHYKTTGPFFHDFDGDGNVREWQLCYGG